MSLDRVPEIVLPFEGIAADIPMIDTSNYIPARNRKIDEIEAGRLESLLGQEQWGRPVTRACNAVLANTLPLKGRPAGGHDRIALPIAADRKLDREVRIQLIDETWFVAFDTGAMADF